MVKISADDKASDVIQGVGDKAGRVASAIGTGLKVAGAAAIAGTALITKSSLDMYSSYEQNLGGIQKIFGNMGKSLEEYAALTGQTVDAAADKWKKLEGAQSTMLANANAAWQTAGLSASAYMEQSTSFGAALVASLGGDTQRAAEYANTAIIDMSDNANTFGTNIQDIQNAYQGFAKQNYTMLDNLKLGYGGTQSEMQRLIKDASKLTDVQKKLGVTVDSSSMSFDNIVAAIHVMQYEMNVGGTTAREAATTIEGSVNAMKAAWDNWLTGLASDDADMSGLTENLTTAFGNVAANVIPRVGQIASTVISQIPAVVSTAAPVLAQTLGDMVNSAAEGIANALPNELGAAFHRGIAAIDSSSLGQALSSVFEGVVPTIQEGLSSIGDTFSGIVDNLPLDTIGDILQTASDVVAGFVSNVGDALPLIAGLAGGFVALQAAIGGIGIVSTIMEFAGAIGGIAEAFTPMMLVVPGIAAAVALLGAGFATAAASGTDMSGAFEFVSAVLEGAQTIFDGVGQAVSTYLLPALSDLGGQFSELLGQLSPFIENVLAPLASILGEVLVGAISGIIEVVAGVLDVITGIVGGVTQLAEMLINDGPNAIATFVDSVGSFLGGLVVSVAGWLGGILGSFGSWAAGVIQWALDAGGGFVSNIGSFLMGLPGSVAGWLAGVISTVAGWVSEFGANAVSAASEFGNKLRDGLASIPGTLGNIGHNIIQGIVDGITGAAGSVKDAIGNAIGNAMDFAKHILGIASPSKVFKRYGYFVMKGMELGISQNAGLPLNATEEAMRAVADVEPASPAAPYMQAANASGQVLDWLQSNLGDVIASRTPYTGMRDMERIARKGVAYA